MYGMQPVRSRLINSAVLLTEKSGENLRLVFLHDYLLLSARLSPMLTHVVLLLGCSTAPCPVLAVISGVELVPLQKLA